MIYNTFKIAEDSSSDLAWEIEVRLYSDGVGISTGLCEFAMIDYVDLSKLVETLEYPDNGLYEVECSIGDNLSVDVYNNSTILYINEDSPLAIIPNPYKEELVSILKQIQK